MSKPAIWLQEQKEKIDSALLQFLPREGVPGELAEAAVYCLQVGGKRLRPLLTLAAAKELGAAEDKVMKVACAVEYIHTYSLIHDDLPAMDNSDLRRGQPTCHLKYGEAAAILAGDALLTLAFELLADYGLTEEGSAAKALLISKELASAAGMKGMVGGQVLDLQGEGKALSLEELGQMNGLKTGALLQAAVRCGALAAGASSEQLYALTGYASCLGLAFQIVDDLLDREGSLQQLGKQPGADQLRFKATYPALMGDEAAKQRVEELYRTSITSLDALNGPAEILRELARRLVYRKS